MPRQPLISWEKRRGVASCRCVRPILITSSFSASRRFKTSMQASTAGRSEAWTAHMAAICIAVGKVSFELCDMLTVSFGCSSASPTIALPRFAMTSLTFIFVWVPLPVCQTESGNSPSSLPPRISSQTSAISAQRRSSSFPRSRFASAAAFFSTAKARMISIGMRSFPIGKFSRLRCVCAPHSLSAGTFISPRESCSIRYSILKTS